MCELEDVDNARDDSIATVAIIIFSLFCNETLIGLE